MNFRTFACWLRGGHRWGRLNRGRYLWRGCERCRAVWHISLNPEYEKNHHLSWQDGGRW